MSQFICENCKLSLATKFSLSRHKLTCDKDEYAILEEKYDTLTEKYNTLLKKNNNLSEKYNKLNTDKLLIENKYEYLNNNYENAIKENQKYITENQKLTAEYKILRDEHNSLLHKFVEKYTEKCDKSDNMLEHVVISNNKTTKNAQTIAFNALNLLNKHCPNAPNIQMVDPDQATKLILMQHKGIKYSIEEADKICINKETNEFAVEILLIKIRADKLLDFMVQTILCYYKKDDPLMQAIWSSDTSRLIFIIKKAVTCDEIKVSKWITDKNGVELKRNVVTPFIQHIKKLISSHCAKLKRLMKKADLDSKEMTEHKYQQESVIKILSCISDPKFPKQIISDLTSYFDIKKDIPMLAITDGKVK